VSRPRLMLIISSSALGGAELTFRHLVQFVDVDRYDVCAVTPPWPDVADLTRTRGIEHVVLALGGRPRIGIARALGRVMKRWRPDIVHSQLLNGDVYAALAGRGVRSRRLVSTVQGVNFQWNLERFPRRQRYWALARVYRGLYAAFDAVVTCSHAVRTALSTGPGVKVPAEKITVIHNSVDLVGLRAAAANVQSAPRRRRRLVTVGNLGPVKGHELLLRALPTLEDLDVECAIVGDGPLRAHLEAVARQLGVASRVMFLGVRADVPALVQDADLFVFPSLWEGFGIAVVEAMALGVPVVAVRRGGIPEIVEEGISGLLVPPDDPALLASAIRRGLTDTALRSRLVPAGRRAAEAFDAREMVAKYEGWYGTLLGVPSVVVA